MSKAKIVFSTTLLIFALVPGNKSDGICEFFESQVYGVSEPCLEQLHVVCNNSELAWKLFDSSSKFFTSGKTYSNVIDYGNYPECLSIDYEGADERIIGKFCAFSTIIVNIFLQPQIEDYLRRFGVDTNASEIQEISADTFNKMRENSRDLLVPSVDYVLSKYSTCVPDACTPKEVANFFLYGHLSDDNNITLVMFTNLTCETVNSNTDYEAGDVAVITLFALVGALMIASTAYDALCQNFSKEPHHPLLLSFSLLHNGKKLLEISTDTTEQIQCFSGMRSISMMWVIAFHAVAPFEGGVIGLVNFQEVKEWDSRWTSQYINSANLAVDTFFFISGFLLAFTHLKRSSEDPVEEVKKVPEMYLHRYLRLTPSVGAMYLVAITFFRHLGSGPTWSLVANNIKEVCKDQWWKFFLYIQNYTDPDTMCIVPTWYLSADMQMFILAPLVIIPLSLYLKRRFKYTMMGLVGLTALAIIIPILLKYFIQDDAGNIYMTHDRFPNFLLGITFGAYMRMRKQKPFIFSSSQNFWLWVLVLAVSLAFNIYWHDVLHHYDHLKYTLFMGLYRPVWCLCLIFMVYSCYHNHGSIIQWFLSGSMFQILGKLSYSMYVIHFLVEIYAGASIRTNNYFSNYFLFYNFCGHFAVTLIMSVVWVLAFEFPMLTIDKYIFGGGTYSYWFVRNRRRTVKGVKEKN